jgi:hypothetical protein
MKTRRSARNSLEISFRIRSCRSCDIITKTGRDRYRIECPRRFLGARILAVVDCYDADVDRPYRRALAPTGLPVIEERSGTMRPGRRGCVPQICDISKSARYDLPSGEPTIQLAQARTGTSLDWGCAVDEVGAGEAWAHAVERVRVEPS